MRRKKPVYFICTAIKDNNLLSQKIETNSLDEAMDIFRQCNGVPVQAFHGPFFARRPRSLGTKNIVFGSSSFLATYNNWKVRAIELNYPPNCAFLLFQERIDGKLLPKPTGTYIVKCEDLIK